MKRLLAVMAAIVLLAAGCGDDDEEAATTTTGGGQAAGGNLREYCEAALAIETAPEPDIDFEALSPQQQAEASQDYAREKIRPLADRVVAVAPEAIRGDITILSRAVDEVAQTGNFEQAFGKPEVEAAEDRVHDYDLRNCGWTAQEVTGVDYAFQGIPQTVQAGVVSFEFAVPANAREVHELVILRKNQGVTESFQQLLQLPEEQARQKTTSVGGVEPIKPGEDGYSVATLEPGQYLAACFLPVGATPALFQQVEAGQAQPPEAPPHAVAQGMRTEFTVR